MKTILVPTDFSKIALNAIDYAAEIAVIAKAKLILFHVYDEIVPLISIEATSIYSIADLRQRVIKELKKIETRLHKKYGLELSIETKFSTGFTVNEINNIAQNFHVDLIVMGMEGAGYLREKLIGSTTTSLIQKSECPVLAIDKHVKFKNIKKIALASDYEEMNNKKVLGPLKEIAQLFNAHIYLLNVVPELETSPYLSKQVEGYKIDHILEGFEHTFHKSENEDLIEGINNFIDEEKIDMLVMIPKTHTMIENLFNEANTKRMAFHSRVPLLTIHE